MIWAMNEYMHNRQFADADMRGDRMMFVELKKLEYYRGGYISNPTMFAVDDIARVVRCTDDYSRTNIITKDRKGYTIAERYEDVAKKIRDAERRTDA